MNSEAVNVRRQRALLPVLIAQDPGQHSSHGAAALQRGLTLIELLIVVAIASILAAIAVPNMAEFAKNNARSTRLNDLSTAINVARNAAVTGRLPTAFCAASTPGGTTCGGTAFEFGVLVVQSNTSAVANAAIVPVTLPVATAPWRLLRVFPGTDTVANNFALTGGVTHVIFQPTGLTIGSVANTAFTHCDSRGQSSCRAIVLSAPGHPGVTRDSDADGIHDINGVNLTYPASLP
jgi:type IV fimbrial biogenesis protein FimT